ncbi:TrmB family transcriptional regulator [Halolamina rubra]|uniref:TrmB family transcriptional regulator n=1 Tax=Halolamina rubra TaxID=1380430 RepID=UPI00067953C8|nr:TrmB family transcriptional regulator [Halolamina rubra]
MANNHPDSAWTTATEQLQALGLSAYAARTFVALVRLGDGSAKEVSENADVPRTRVYDAVEELADLGLVDVQHSSPKRFWAVSTETTGQHFDREYSHRVNTLTDALDQLSTGTRSTEQRGVWTVTGRETVTERIDEFVSSAEEEVVYMTVDDLLTERLTDSLADAADRGVSIQLAGMADGTEGHFDDALPEATYFESIWDWADTPAGRLLMVDREKTLVSVLVDDGDAPSRAETAIWGSGSANGLVVVLKAMFAWQLDRDHDDGAADNRR